MENKSVDDCRRVCCLEGDRTNMRILGLPDRRGRPIERVENNDE